jgi:hypothetical protein
LSNNFKEESLGLKLKGYSIVPNSTLQTKISVYTPEIVQSILLEHPEIVENWLQKLHDEYISKKKSCDFDNDPVACFTVAAYEEFERHFKSWQDGGLVSIAISADNVIRVSKKPLISVASNSIESHGDDLVCSRCFAHFADIDEFAKHCKQEIDAKFIHNNVAQAPESIDTIPPNPIWWPS